MRYTDLTELGGFLWWLLVRFCKTKLKEEQTKEKWSRNLLFLMLLVIIITFISIKCG